MKSKPRWMESVIEAAKAETHVVPIRRRKPARSQTDRKAEAPSRA